MRRALALVLPWLMLLGCTHMPKPHASHPAPVAATTKSSGENGSYVFGWGFQPEEVAKPRGGTTKGTAVRLAPPVERKSALGESAFARDRAAILAMAGDFRTSFHFIETIGLAANYTNTRPYLSWATEHVRVLEDKGEFISLQHTLVMFFADETATRADRC